MSDFSVNAERLLGRIRSLGQIGRDEEGRLTRLASSDTDKLGRDRFVDWATDAGCRVIIDRIGNIFAIWAAEPEALPLMIGSHIDTVVDAGFYDGCYGVLAGLEVIETLNEAGFVPSRPLVVAAFTNEEGVRYAPDMMGSLVYAGGMSTDDALATVGVDGTVLGDELSRIGYAGAEEPGFLRPYAYVELHIEQGPILERDALSIGAVENLQGISWQRVTIEGVANHAGTTPTHMRSDAGLAAARLITFLRDYALRSNGTTVATVGTMKFEPNAINVIPSRATFTIDLRDPDKIRLQAAEAVLASQAEEVATAERVSVAFDRLARFEPVTFDARIVRLIEECARLRGLSCRRMTSGAGHDAQMMARLAPSAMIFVPSRGGISHNPREHTEEEQLVAGANVLLDVVMRLAGPR